MTLKPFSTRGASAVVVLMLMLQSPRVAFAQAADIDPASTQPATAPASRPAESLPDAVALIQESVKAMGGKKAFDAIDSTMIKATLQAPKGDMNLEFYSARPDRFLMKRSQDADGETTIGSDGTIGWMKDPSGGYQLLDDEQIKAMRQEGDMFRMSVNMLDDFTDHHTVDQVTFNGMDCYKVIMKDKKGLEQVAYFAVDDKLVQGFDKLTEGDMGALKSSIMHGDWREVGDVKVFHKMTIGIMGQTVSLVFDKVELNNVDAAVFTAPPEVKALKDKKPATAPSTQPSGGSRGR